MVKELTMANPPPDEVSKYLSELAKRLDGIGFELNVFKSEMSSRFKLKIQKDLPIFTNVIVLPIKESVAYSKHKDTSFQFCFQYIYHNKRGELSFFDKNIDRRQDMLYNKFIG